MSEISKEREDRFTVKSGEMQFVPSQCADCLNNVGVNECKVYGHQPDQFRDNEEDCPSKLIKQD